MRTVEKTRGTSRWHAISVVCFLPTKKQRDPFVKNYDRSREHPAEGDERRLTRGWWRGDSRWPWICNYL